MANRESDYKGESEKKEENNRTGSNIHTFVHIVCAIAGAGVLGLSSATAKGSYWSLILLALMGLIATYTGNLIIKCLYYENDPDKRLKGYPEVAEASFGFWGKRITQVFTYAACLCSVLLYIILTSSNIVTIFYPKLDITKHKDEIIMKKRIYVWVAGGAIALLFCFVKTLKEVTMMSIFGVATTFFTIIVSVGLSSKKIFDGLPPPSFETPNDSNHWILLLASSMCTFAFAFGGSVVFPQIESTMKDRKKWAKVLSISMLFMGIFYTLIATVGYAAFGKELVNVSNITESINSWVKDRKTNSEHLISSFNIASIVLISLHVLLASPIYLCTVSLDFEEMLGITVKKLDTKKEFIYRVAFRFSMVVCLTAIGCGVPDFGPVLNLISALVIAPLVFIIPIMFYTKLFGYKTLSVVEKILFVAILIIGTLCTCIGAYEAGEEVWKELIKGKW